MRRRLFGFKKIVALSAIVLLSVSGSRLCAQDWTLKTNALYWLTGTVNLGVEAKLAPKWTAEVDWMYNPITWTKENHKVTGMAVQPEVKYWFCQHFYKHYLGLHLNYADYNAGLKDYRYQGYLLGAGVSYGYQMILAPRWNMEFNIGVGYARMDHDVYLRPKCGNFVEHRIDHYVGITQLGVSLVYILK